MTVDERRLLVAETKQMLERYRAEEGLESLSDAELRAHCLADEVGIFIAMLNKMNDDELRAIDPLLPKGWFRYPFNTMAEPHKRVRTINSWRIKDGPHAANLMKRASLHAIDRFFMQIRRLIIDRKSTRMNSSHKFATRMP